MVVLNAACCYRLDFGRYSLSSCRFSRQAVCYHNLAVALLRAERYEEACEASMNCRRLARVSLSYSNRWLPAFDATHRACLSALSLSSAVRGSMDTEEQAELFNQLASELFSDDPKVNDQ